MNVQSSCEKESPAEIIDLRLLSDGALNRRRLHRSILALDARSHCGIFARRDASMLDLEIRIAPALALEFWLLRTVLSWLIACRAARMFCLCDRELRSNLNDIITNTSPAFIEGDMNGARFALIVIGAGIVSSLTDWFFAGDWLHRRYTYPEIWRQRNESRAIALTSPLPFLTCGMFAFVLVRLGLHSVASTVKLAVAV
jgi:hypothetical protein